MGVFGNFTNKVQTGARSKGPEYSLNEILVALDMASNEVSKDKIAEALGRSKDSLNYKIFEGQTTIKGKTNVRSIKRYWFVDPTKKGSAFVDEEVALKRLFAAHNEEYKGEQDIQDRIALWCDENGVEMATEESEGEVA